MQNNAGSNSISRCSLPIPNCSATSRLYYKRILQKYVLNSLVQCRHFKTNDIRRSKQGNVAIFAVVQRYTRLPSSRSSNTTIPSYPDYMIYNTIYIVYINIYMIVRCCFAIECAIKQNTNFLSLSSSSKPLSHCSRSNR